MSSEETTPFELGRTVELVRDAFIEAMQDEGITPRTRLNISARAQHHIHLLLEDDVAGE